MSQTRDPRDPRYAAVGVDSTKAEDGLSRLRTWVEKTFTLNPAARPHLPLGYFANIIRLDGLNTGIAISTDGVGTKLLVAEQLGKYDTVGIDCIAMNVNDLLCVGATPVSFVDYIAVEELAPEVLEKIGEGLFHGAAMARVSICGGEIAQIREMVRGIRPGSGFDLAGTAIGTVPLDRVIIGEEVQPGEVVIGLASSGIHSNGLTLARRILLHDAKLTVDSYVREFGRTVGEELLEPTRIYVPEITAMFAAEVKLKALIHLTGDGFFNLTRTAAPIGYQIHTLPPVPPIFSVLQELGNLSDAEMFQVYNMGIGFCVVVEEADAERVLQIAAEHNTRAWRIGVTVASAERVITIEPRRLRSQAQQFVALSN
ncbi:MAG: phosphoribosylformylglycinamidine cyclo-ligase [Deltaproteobacteria bacterium]|nr:phosphoribosylformylglycinamidine cyclo-ligase [Deltaproteobacteria bacterium]